MIVSDGITLREYLMAEPLPLSVIQQAVFDFLRGRSDAAVYGSMAVNAYASERRNTEDVDIAATQAEQFAELLRTYLHEQFHIKVRVRAVKNGLGYRIYQVRKEGNRHLVDVRAVDKLPPSRMVEDVPIVTPEEVIAGKVMAYTRRRNKPKAGTDWRDLAVMLLAFPELKRDEGPIRERLLALGASEEALALWREIVAQEIVAGDDDDEFDP